MWVSPKQLLRAKGSWGKGCEVRDQDGQEGWVALGGGGPFLDPCLSFPKGKQGQLGEPHATWWEGVTF